MKRTLFSLFLFITLVAPVTVSIIIIRYQKRMVRKEIKRKIIAGIDKNELVLLKFSEKDKQNLLKWEHSKEFEYLGEMYDVVETNTVGDTTSYWCWWDYEETKLNKQLSKLVHAAWGDNPLNRENNKRLFAFFKLLFYTESKDNTLFAFKDSECEFVYTTEQLPSPPGTPLVPPPKMIQCNFFLLPVCFF